MDKKRTLLNGWTKKQIGDILFAVGGFDGKSFLKSIEYLNCANQEAGWSMYYKPDDFRFLFDSKSPSPSPSSSAEKESN